MARRVLVFVFVLAGMGVADSVLAQQNRVDTVSPAAPELASFGRYAEYTLRSYLGGGPPSFVFKMSSRFLWVACNVRTPTDGHHSR
jgi:hypothetical protein